ncbi:MAG: RyR domain-containing protein [Methanoregulaceae archaeon]
MIEENDENFNNLLNTLPALLFFVNDDGTIVWENRACEDLFKSANVQTGEKNIVCLFPDEKDEFLQDIHTTITSREIKTGLICTIDIQNSGKKTLKFDIIPYKQTKGDIQRAIVFGLDITEQVEMERLKRDAYEQIEKNMEQFQILNDQIRNPIQIITGLVTLEEGSYQEKILKQTKLIDNLISNLDKGWVESEKVRNVLKKYYDVGFKGTHELVARAIHEEYLEQQKKLGINPQTNPSMLPWNELPRNIQDSNLKQVDGIWRKLHLIQCAIGFSSEKNEPPFKFSNDEIEVLARYEHERWMNERVSKGWKYGSNVNHATKTHDCLVPWEQLSELQKEKDRNTIRTLPGILAKVNLKIVRLGS